MTNTKTHADVVVVGAGFSGVYMTHKLVNEQGLIVRGIEEAPTVGGTWYWNKYPGARCDVISTEYAYTTDQEIIEAWDWTERYSSQPEIQAYIEFAAEKWDVKKHFTFETRVESAVFNETDNIWTVETNTGEIISARFLVTAVGCLSTGFLPDFEGRDDFEGISVHPGRWPEEGTDFSNKRVAIIGTGSTAVQIIPLVAEEADELVVFQRTPAFEMEAGNRPLTDEEREEFRKNIDDYREISANTGSGQPVEILPHGAMDDDDETRNQVYEERWARHRAIDMLSAYPDHFSDDEANHQLAEFFRSKIADVVEDPLTLEKLTPRGFPIGSKRITVGTNYYQTFNRENVRLIDVNEEPISRITSTGIKTAQADLEFDAIIYATGYDAVTGPLLRIDIRGTNGLSLADKWEDGPHTYLGVAVNGFPNMFMITGPGSPNVLTNVMCAIEQHVEWISDAIEHLVAEDIDFIEPEKDAESEWTELTESLAQQTLYVQSNNWYVGGNIPGKPRVLMTYVGGLNTYRTLTDEVAADNYRGFNLKASITV